MGRVKDWEIGGGGSFGRETFFEERLVKRGFERGENIFKNFQNTPLTWKQQYEIIRAFSSIKRFSDALSGA